MFRVGIGHDTHRLVEGRNLVLGGVIIPWQNGSEGHSDGDALTHAVIDALLGALGQGDIGTHFPDFDPRWKDAHSIDLLARVAELVATHGFHVINVDSTVLIERPRLKPHIELMREKLAEALGILLGRVSVKAKTAEGMDAVGEERAVVAQAVVLLGTGSNSQ